MSKQDKGVVHDTMVLTLITLVAGAVLGGVHHITAGPIAAEKEREETAAKQAVFAEATSFEDIDIDADAIAQLLQESGIDQTTVYSASAAKDDAGNTIGYVVDAGNNEGYGGEVELMVGVRSGEAPAVTGISFLNLEETAGMGMRAQEPEFKDQFNGIDLSDANQVVYTKSGKSKPNEIDAISGCTVTTNAVTKAVNGALAATWNLGEEGASK